MKDFYVQEYQVSELNFSEMKNCNGGVLPAVVAGIIVAVVVEVIRD